MPKFTARFHAPSAQRDRARYRATIANLVDAGDFNVDMAKLKQANQLKIADKLNSCNPIPASSHASRSTMVPCTSNIGLIIGISKQAYLLENLTANSHPSFACRKPAIDKCIKNGHLIGCETHSTRFPPGGECQDCKREEFARIKEERMLKEKSKREEEENREMEWLYPPKARKGKERHRNRDARLLKEQMELPAMENVGGVSG